MAKCFEQNYDIIPDVDNRVQESPIWQAIILPRSVPIIQTKWPSLIPDKPETKLNAIDRRKAITTAFIDKVCNDDADCGKDCGTYAFVKCSKPDEMGTPQGASPCKAVHCPPPQGKGCQSHGFGKYVYSVLACSRNNRTNEDLYTNQIYNQLVTTCT